MKKGVQKIYTEVAPSYELINHLLTFGLDIRWRKKAVREIKKHGGSLFLDLCSGTGEIAHYLSQSADHNEKIISVDFSLPMLLQAKKKHRMQNVLFSLADVGLLPFRDNGFDNIVIAFATRNINPNPEAMVDYFKEFHRVLKPGGTFVNLETSQPRSRFLKKLFHFYVKHGVKKIGGSISGSKAGYKYLAHTIPRFYPAEELTQLLHESGFNQIECQPLFLNIAAIHVATKGVASQHSTFVIPI